MQAPAKDGIKIGIHKNKYEIYVGRDIFDYSTPGGIHWDSEASVTSLSSTNGLISNNLQLTYQYLSINDICGCNWVESNSNKYLPEGRITMNDNFKGVSSTVGRWKFADGTFTDGVIASDTRLIKYLDQNNKVAISRSDQTYEILVCKPASSKNFSSFI